ncbi:hypothetical protein BDZ94DRAFT_737289 [Collybia nuda]|uniref:Uncharacterized protein n=1 Tax=Collybia nuda TaxID=64659 RepID=A0A9P6CDY3_9AGAR|nr:hypothetical protein BDZ94DRAFT_737289 [Collybia nuda]
MFTYPTTTFPLYQLAWFFLPLLIQTLLLGLYVVLFSICVHILLSRRTRNWKLLLATTIVMFGLSVAQTTISILHVFSAKFTIMWPVIQDLLYVITNVVADGLFVYRCYVIWEYNKYVILGPIMLLIATTGFGFATIWFSGGVPLGSVPVHGLEHIYDTRTFFFISITTNGILTILTAGRIWWITRKIRNSPQKMVIKKYNTAIAIVLESGLIYCLSVAVYLVCMSTDATPPANYDADKYLVIPNLRGNIAFAALTQIVGIVPTLIIVRMCLGLSAPESASPLSTLRFKSATDEFVVIDGQIEAFPKGLERFSEYSRE